jgi:drug/metabolite transporter (DMT)-like permease
MSALLALLSSISFGAADFLGGLATRRTNRVLAVVVLSQVTGMALVVIALALTGGELQEPDILWAAGAGIVGALGLVLLYRGLSIGTMSVVAPLSAVMTALVPVGWGLLSGERPSAPALAAVPIAIVAIALVSGAAGGGAHRGPGVVEGIGAGVGFGAFFILIAQTESAELWTLTFARIASISVLSLIAVSSGAGLRPGRGAGWLIAGAGAIDMAANLLFLLAERRGLLTLVSVITALYPATTVLLARVVLRERLSRPQLIGLGLAAVGVAMIAAG